jgi:hypothetical protein
MEIIKTTLRFQSDPKATLRNLLRKVSHAAENRATVNSNVDQDEQANGERS